MALDAGADILTHVPLVGIHDEILRLVKEKRVCVPTLTMMEGISGAHPGHGSFANAQRNTEAMHTLGATVLAGTDSNQSPGVPFSPPYGSSLHHELELLVGAGMSTVDALRAATVLPAECFGLVDRGRVEPGLRADLVLIADDPIQDIRATRTIQKVWCGGQLYEPAIPHPPPSVKRGDIS